MTFPQEALERFLDGKEYLNARCYALAVHDLHYAKEIYDEYYGKLANECGEVYYFLGKALWCLSLEELFDSEREKNKIEEDKKELSESTDSPPAVFDEGSTDTKLKVAECSPQEVYLDDSFHSVCGHCIAEKMEEDGIISKRQLSDYYKKLSWKYLEDAQLIYERRGTAEAELCVARILMTVSGIHEANANYSSAIKIYKRYVKMYEKYSKPDEKFYADIYGKLGVLHRKAQIYPEALKYLQKSKQMYEMECENLRNTIVDADIIFKCEIEKDILDLRVFLTDVQRDIELAEQLMNKKKEE